TAPGEGDVGGHGERRTPLRETQHRAHGAGRPQEGPETTAHVRLVAGGGGVEWTHVQALLARDTHTPMGRERALGLEPRQDVEEIVQALAETRQARSALEVSGAPPWESMPDVRPTLEAGRVPGSVAAGVRLA